MNQAPHNGLPLTRPLWEANTPLAGEALPSLPRLTVYEKEGHGIGLAKNHPWGTAMLKWLENRRGATCF